MILNRSPFYYNIVLANSFVTSIDFFVEICTGTLTAPTVVQSYELSKPKAFTTQTNIYLDVSPFARDIYEFYPIDFTGIAANQVNASTSLAQLITRVTATQINTLGTSITPTSNKYISTYGYSEFSQGQNLQPTQKILLSHTNYLADARGYFIVPLSVTTGDSNPTVNGVASTLSFTDGQYVKYLIIPVANYTGVITVVFMGESITIQVVTECKYDINQLQFVNRFGALEVLHFYKTKKDTIQVKRENFKNAHTNGVSYDVRTHQKNQYNAIGTQSFKLETGFLNEDYNATIQELLLSEHIWIDQTPVNIVSGSLEYKTKIVDRLITYSLDFEYAYDLINNV